MWKRLSIAVLSGTLMHSAFAGIESVQVTGKGASRSAAVDAALISAVEQVVGVDISNERTTHDIYKETEEGFELSESSTGKAKFGSTGNATYRILSESCEAKQCTVRLVANVEYDDDKKRQKSLKGMNSNRRTLAIAPFDGAHSKTLTRAIETRFVQDRLFSVVADASKPGVDYLLKGEVLEAKTTKRVSDTRKTIELTGETVGQRSTHYSSRVIVEYQMVDLINNQIKWSAKVPTTSGRDNLPLLIDIASRKIFDQLKDNIYPLVLLTTSDGRLVFNSGGKTVRKGELYNIFAVGEEITDPYTKESLGFTERKVGQVKVRDVQSKVAYVELVKGDVNDMQALPVARRAAAAPKRPSPSSSQPAQKPKEVERTSGFIM